MKYWYRIVSYFKTMILRKKSKYTLVNDITNCTFDDIRDQLKGMDYQVLNSTTNGYFVRFSDEYTEYILSFTSGGKVIGIEFEHWKDMDVKFGKANIQ